MKLKSIQHNQAQCYFGVSKLLIQCFKREDIFTKMILREFISLDFACFNSVVILELPQVMLAHPAS